MRHQERVVILLRRRVASEDRRAPHHAPTVLRSPFASPGFSFGLQAYTSFFAFLAYLYTLNELHEPDQERLKAHLGIQNGSLIYHEIMQPTLSNIGPRPSPDHRTDPRISPDLAFVDVA